MSGPSILPPSDEDDEPSDDPTQEELEAQAVEARLDECRGSWDSAFQENGRRCLGAMNDVDFPE
jgi:hypothetical protein